MTDSIGIHKVLLPFNQHKKLQFLRKEEKPQFRSLYTVSMVIENIIMSC